MNIMLHRKSRNSPQPWVKVSGTAPDPQGTSIYIHLCVYIKFPSRFTWMFVFSLWADIVHELRIAVREGGSLSIHGLWSGIRSGIYIQHLKNENQGSKNRRYKTRDCWIWPRPENKVASHLVQNMERKKGMAFGITRLSLMMLTQRLPACKTI